VRPHHSAGGGQVARTLDDILKEIKRAEAAGAGTYAGNPAAQAAAAQAQGHDPLRAYLYRQQQDAAAETSRALARMGQAQLSRQFWASTAGQAQAGAGAREQSAVSLASLQQRVTGERARLDYGATPRGMGEVRQRAGLERELQRLQKESAEAAARLRPFGERVADTGKEFLRVTSIASAAAFGLAKLGELASPSAWQTLQDSMALLGETVGEQVVPLMYKLAGTMQEWDKSIRENLGGDQDDANAQGVSGNVGAFFRDVGRTLISSDWKTQALNVGTFYSYPLVAAGAGRVNQWTGGDNQQANRNYLFGRDMPAMQSFAAPGGKPIAEMTTGERYSEQLNLAGLEVGANDPKTELMQRQIRELEAHGNLLRDISRNQEATNRYLESTRAWR
jgi:hypothetical protein